MSLHPFWSARLRLTLANPPAYVKQVRTRCGPLFHAAWVAPLCAHRALGGLGVNSFFCRALSEILLEPAPCYTSRSP